MMIKRFALVILFSLLSSVVWPDDPSVNNVAKSLMSNVDWKPNSVLSADFTCDGQMQYAILGVTPQEFVVAVFIHGLETSPEVLKFRNGPRDEKTISITLETLDHSLEEIGGYLGEVPEGWFQSQRCKGINLSDGKIDSAHIYWNHKRKVFSVWMS